MPLFKPLLLLLTLLLMGISGISAQERLTFSIADFDTDPFDLSAKDAKYEKFDGNGDRYAIVKVTSTNPTDNLNEYNFNFGNMKHIVEEHDGVLWIYVQRNAKLVTITRNGYAPVSKYDLGTSIQSGKNYVMSLTSDEKKVYTQMIQFNIKPANSKAIVMIKNAREGSQEELFGNADSSGEIAKSLEFGTYTYKVLADNYHMSEGRFTLNNKSETLIEDVTLHPNFSDITFIVDADAEIYINNELKGTRQWSGVLKSGNYQVECRQANHKPTSQFVQVTENDNRTINLKAPEPILGTAAITSTPLGAEIIIDGKSYGQTPKNLDLIIGKHTVEIAKSGYQTESQSFEVKENRTTELSLTLSKTTKTLIESIPTNAEIYIDGEYKGSTPYTYEGDAGEHTLRLSYYGFKNLNKKVYFGKSDNLSFLLQSNKYVKKTDFYIEAGLGIGEVPNDANVGPLNIAFAIGRHYRNFNFELDFSLLNIIKKEVSEANFYTPQYNVGLKFGYGIIMGNNLKFTPQIGFKLIMGKDYYSYYQDNDIGGYANITISLRLFYALSKRFGISLTPEYGIAGDDLGGFNTKLSFVTTF